MFGKSCIDDFSAFGIYWQPNLLFGSFVAERPVWKTNCTLLTDRARVQKFWTSASSVHVLRTRRSEFGIWNLATWPPGLWCIQRTLWELKRATECYRCQRLSKHLILRRVPCWPGAGGCCGAPVRVCRRIHLVWSYESSWWGWKMPRCCSQISSCSVTCKLYVSYMTQP